MHPNLASPRFKADPYPFYARLREEAPVVQVRLPNRQSAWLITRYDDVLTALIDPRLAKDRLQVLTPEQVSKQPWVPEFFKPLTRNMLDLDAPDHTRLRGLVHKAFTPRLVENLRRQIEVGSPSTRCSRARRLFVWRYLPRRCAGGRDWYCAASRRCRSS